MFFIVSCIFVVVLSVFANELFKYNMVFSPLNNWPLNIHCIKANLKYYVENIILDARGSG